MSRYITDGYSDDAESVRSFHGIPPKKEGPPYYSPPGGQQQQQRPAPAPAIRGGMAYGYRQQKDLQKRQQPRGEVAMQRPHGEVAMQQQPHGNVAMQPYKGMERQQQQQPYNGREKQQQRLATNQMGYKKQPGRELSSQHMLDSTGRWVEPPQAEVREGGLIMHPHTQFACTSYCQTLLYFRCIPDPVQFEALMDSIPAFPSPVHTRATVTLH